MQKIFNSSRPKKKLKTSKNNFQARVEKNFSASGTKFFDVTRQKTASKIFVKNFQKVFSELH